LRGLFRSRNFGQGYLPWIRSGKSSFTAPDPGKPAPPVWRPNTRGKDSETRRLWGEGSTHGGPPVIPWCLAGRDFDSGWRGFSGSGRNPWSPRWNHC
jgi:hypothetical protein